MREKNFSIGQIWKRFTSALLTVTMIAVYMPLAETSAADADDMGYQVVITERIDTESGFKHPGIGLTKDILENVREQVQNKVEPWYSYYVSMSNHSFAATDVTANNQSGSDPTKPDSVAFNSQGFNSRFIADGLKAYTQALMYVITGEEVYRANGMRIIRIWSQMDPNQYVYFNDAHIHTGIPLNRMATAAEILRYTSSPNPDLAWTEQDTEDFTNNLVMPTINTFMFSKDRFMNQHSYSVLGAMAGYLFADDKAGYEKEVEWWSVNKDAIDQGFNGSIKQLFRLIEKNDLTGEPVDPPVIQHVEMGRDQAHGGGDLTNAAITVRMLNAQGTKLDPVAGTASTAANAVEPMEFLDHRIIKAADYFWQFMLGYDPDWVPVAYSIAPDGTVNDTYNRIASGYKGRFATTNFWDFYSYYTYEKGENIEEIAPYYAEAFTKKQFQNWQNVDGGEEYWLYLPAEAAADAEKFLPPQQPNLAERNEVEIRYTALDANTQKLTEDAGEEEIQFIRFNATEAGAKIALLSGGTGSKTIGFKIRSNGIAQLDVGGGIKDTLTLPDTHGEWRYVTYMMNEFQGIGDFYELNVRGANGVIVDLDHISFVASALEAPKFQLGNADSEIFSYVGVPITIDFSATGATGIVVTYEGADLPAGAQLNAETGVFSWEQPVVGQHAFVVTASDGTIVTTKSVVIHSSADRSSAIAETIAPYDVNTKYSAASLAQYQAVYEDTISKSATQTDDEFVQQLLLLRAAVESLELVSPRAFDGSLDYTKTVSSNMGTGIASLLDDDNDTFTGFASGHGASQTLDFGTDYKVSATAFGVQSRMNFTDRGAGVAIFGSNDNKNWTRLTPGETIFNSGMNVIEVDEQYLNEQYRFIKYQMVTRHPDIIHNSVQSILELGEFRIYGERHEIGNKLELVTFGTSQGIKGRITQGDVATLTIKAKEEISDVQVMIQGVNATLTTIDQVNWTATAMLNSGVATGPVTIKVDYKKQDGSQGDTAYATTDNSTLYFMDESDVIENVPNITALIDSTTNRTAQGTLDQVRNLFDGNEFSISDFRDGSGGAGNGSFITFDFKKGNQASISSVELLARQDGNYGRIGGVVVQGSNDNLTWTTLTDPAASTLNWQVLNSKDSENFYRYIRIYNGNAWYGNMGEVRFHGKVVSLFADLLNEAEIVDRTIYTEDSLAVLDAAVLTVETAMENESATQADLNSAALGLQAALADLAYKPEMPVLKLEDKTIAAGNKLTFDVQAVNVDATDEAAYEAEDLPEGAEFNAATGVFEWTPALDQGGVHTVTFKAALGDKSSAKTIQIKVIGGPIVDEDELIEQMDVKVGETISYSVPVLSDASGGSLVFTADGLPAGAVLNSMNGTFKWTPTNVDYGTHSIMFKASNCSFGVEVPLEINVALNILPADNYTKGSYYVYSTELARIQAELDKPEANIAALARQIAAAEKELVQVPLPIYSVVKIVEDEEETIASSLITDIAAGTTSLVEGKYSGRAVKFQAGTNDYLQLPGDTPFKNYNEITIATWVKWDGGSDWQRIFDFGNNQQQYLFLAPQSGAGNKELRFAIKNGGTEQIMDAGKLPIGQWTHVAVTLGNGTGKMYVNGELKTTNNSMTIKPSDFKPAVNYIGKSQYPDPLYRGLIDNFTIYNYVLDAYEIREVMDRPAQWLDTTLLEQKLAQADQLLESDYTADSWSVFTSALNEARAVYANAASTQAQVDAAAEDLKAAIEQLEPGINVTELSEAIAEANRLLAEAEAAEAAGEPYPVEVVDALQAAVGAATLVLNDTDAIQSEVDEAAIILAEAIETYKAAIEPTEPVVNKDALHAAIGEALTLLEEADAGTKPGQYLLEAIEAFDTAIEAAEAVVVNAEADQAAVDAALSDLATAIEEFKAAVNKETEPEPEPEPTVDNTALNDLIAEATTLLSDAEAGTEPGQYPLDAIEAFDAAIEAAEAVAANAEADQAAVDSALSDLAAAIEEFKEAVNKEVEPEPEPTVDKTELNNLIAEARTLLDDADVGTEAGQFPLEAIEALDAAIEAAEAVAANAETDQAAVDAALSDLAAAIEEFKAAVNKEVKPEPEPEPSKDTEAPTWEDGSAVTASKVGTTSVTLTWDAAKDNVEVTGYKVTWKVGTEKHTQEVAKDVTSIKIKGLKSSRSYTFKVAANDEAGNWSAELEVTVKTKTSYNPPAEPEQSTEPEQPAEPEQLTEPEQPVEPEQPTEPEQPEQPQLNFSDVPENHWAASAIKRAAALGIVKGHLDNTFKPNASTTRAEFMTMLANAFKWKAEKLGQVDQSQQDEQAGVSFTDNDTIGAWAVDAIIQGIQRGIITGYTDGSFRPNQEITRTEMIVMLARALGVSNVEIARTQFTDDAAIPAWGKGAVEALRELGIVTGRSNNSFAPNDEATRAEALVIIMRVLDNNS